MRKKNGSVADFKMDAVNVSAIGFCSKWGKSDFYDPKTVKLDDSKCCKTLLVPRKPPVEEKIQSGEIY